MARILLSIGILLLVAVVSLRCAPPPLTTPAAEPVTQPDNSSEAPPEPVQEPASGTGAIRNDLAKVDQVEVLTLESFPVQIHVVASGNLPDGCTTIDQVTTKQTGNEFAVTITTQRPIDLMCTEALVPFEEVIPLDVAGLPAGPYTVIVNGVSGSFELAVDN